MELDDVWDSFAVVHGLFVGEEEVDGDAEVAADDDHGRSDQVQGKHGDDEREALVLHLRPGQRAGQAEGLGAVTPPTQDGKQSPDQSVEPDPHAQQLHRLPTDFLPCGKENRSFFLVHFPQFIKEKRQKQSCKEAS